MSVDSHFHEFITVHLCGNHKSANTVVISDRISFLFWNLAKQCQSLNSNSENVISAYIVILAHGNQSFHVLLRLKSESHRPFMTMHPIELPIGINESNSNAFHI